MVKTIVIAFFLVFKQWLGSCTRPFYRICENHCERKLDRITVSLFTLRTLLCTLYFVFSILSQETKLRSFHSRLFLVSKIESLNGHSLESATRIQGNCQCIKPSFLQHCMWNAEGGRILMPEGSVSKRALFNQICVLYIAVYLIISRTFWKVLITEITALYRPSVTNSISN